MTSVERLVQRLRSQGVDVPDGYVFQSVRPGLRQRQAGAWSWVIGANHRDVLASFYPVGELLRASSLEVTERTRLSCPTVEIASR